MRSIRVTLLLMALVGVGGAAYAQDAPRAQEAYFRAVGEFFGVSAGELPGLRDWRLAPDEIPVALFVAERAGVSADALVALRSSGSSWADLIARYGISPAAFHVPIPEQSPAGLLSVAYERYRGTPPGQWGNIRLQPQDIVALVNVRLLAQTLGIPPAEVLSRAGTASSFVEVYGELIR